MIFFIRVGEKQKKKKNSLTSENGINIRPKMRWLDGITDSKDRNLSKLREVKGEQRAWLQSTGSRRVRHDLTPEQQ